MIKMKKNNIKIHDTFAEAFPMKATRLIITANSKKWAIEAAKSFTGFATSVIACGCEAGVEAIIDSKLSPDGRPGVSILVFSMSEKELTKQIINRAGQCVMTTPTSALYAGNISEKNKFRKGPKIFWRWISNFKVNRWETNMEDSCDGWRVRV